MLALRVSSEIGIFISAMFYVAEPLPFLNFYISIWNPVNITFLSLELLWVCILYGRFVYYSKRMYNAIYLKYRYKWALIAAANIGSLAMQVIICNVYILDYDDTSTKGFS